jgi:hypothetical protein
MGVWVRHQRLILKLGTLAFAVREEHTACSGPLALYILRASDYNGRVAVRVWILNGMLARLRQVRWCPEVVHGGIVVKAERLKAIAVYNSRNDLTQRIIERNPAHWVVKVRG